MVTFQMKPSGPNNGIVRLVFYSCCCFKDAIIVSDSYWKLEVRLDLRVEPWLLYFGSLLI